VPARNDVVDAERDLFDVVFPELAATCRKR